MVSLSVLLLYLLPAAPCYSATSQPVLQPRPPTVAAQLVVSPELGWPQWNGPRRDGRCDERGLLPRWPAAGPRLLWKTTGLGRGYSAPILTGGRLYLAGDVGDDLRLIALDLEGKVRWQTTNGRAWKGPYPGARASCTFSEGRLYHLNAHGRLACLEAATGAEVWAVNVLERFEGHNLTWALSECVVVDGPRVIVTPGGAKALMAALAKNTGQTLWMTEPLKLGRTDRPALQRLEEPAGELDTANYMSPILFTLGGRRHLVSCSQRHAFGVDATTGELLWTRPLPTRYQVLACTPVLVSNAVFVTGPDAGGGRLFALRPQATGLEVEPLWKTPLDTCHGGAVLVDGALYGSWYRDRRGWACVDAATGALRYETRELAMGPILYADDRLYVLSQDGVAALLKPGRERFEFLGRFPLVQEHKNDVWTHPVILHGRLYLRYHETLFCYDIRGDQSAPR